MGCERIPFVLLKAGKNPSVLSFKNCCIEEYVVSISFLKSFHQQQDINSKMASVVSVQPSLLYLQAE